jgi:UV DNA damage repair endonuclease
VGAHADYVDPADMMAFLRLAPPAPFDCMLEAKQKERAVLRLRDELEARGIVEIALAEWARNA